ncbi:MAG: signal peptidase I [Clostridiales bacterium]|nr:signal peptidase I [Clostridiales bacterium]
MKSRNPRDAVETIFCAIVASLILYVACRPFVISGGSMEPALRDGDRVVVSKISVFLNDIDRNDLIVYKAPFLGGGDETIVKRVVGLPGDRVTISDGDVYLNGDVLDEPFLGDNTTDGEIDIVLKENEYFTLGDNRGVSYDSRTVGPVAADDITGKIIAKWFPLNEFKIF